MLNQPAFGRILHQFVSLGALEFRLEPLDALIKRRLKDAWQQAPCPNCGEHTVQTSEKSPRIWCGNCRYTGMYTLRTRSTIRNSPPVSSSLPSSSTPIPSLASTRSRRYSITPTTPSTTGFDGWKPRSSAASRPSGNVSITRSMVPRRSMRPASMLGIQRIKSAAGRVVPRRITRRWPYPLVGGATDARRGVPRRAACHICRRRLEIRRESGASD